MSKKFNYIITVFNKENLLREVLEGINKSASLDSSIYIVLDGCTDNSESIAKEFQSSVNKNIIILHGQDIHEIKSINLALKQIHYGNCIIVQDDVILDEPNLENLILDLQTLHNNNLGYISFRFAGDIKKDSFINRLFAFYNYGKMAFNPGIKIVDVVANPLEYLNFKKVDFYTFVPKMVGIKSPVCITENLRKKIPVLDEKLAPYNYDDVDLSLESLKCGLINGVFPINYKTDVTWGSTRKDKDFNSIFGGFIRARNERIIYKKHLEIIK